MMKDGIEHCHKCVKLYPDEADFWFALGSWYGFDGDYANGYKYCAKAIEMAPERTDWYFQIAGALRMLTQDGEVGGRRGEILDLYQRYVDLSAPDARSVPNAYYCMAMMHAYSEETDRAQELYDKGMRAETVRLPCFEAIGNDYDPKKSAMLLIAAAKRAGRAGGKSQAKSAQKLACDHCSKKLGFNLFECEACRDKCYCSQNCMKKNAKSHRLQCKQNQNPKVEA
jgi:tetratricopeptide (TPR) repeat protein